jgi:hypothetical protein
MPKRIALNDSVEVDSVDLSNFARTVRFASEHSREDVSGFSPTGANEYLPGPTDQSVTVEFFGSYGTGEVHATLYPIHKDREIVEFKWRPDMNTAVAATNPELRGNVQLYTYGPGGTRGDVDTFEATFNAADEDGLQFFTAAEVGG